MRDVDALAVCGWTGTSGGFHLSTPSNHRSGTRGVRDYTRAVPIKVIVATELSADTRVVPVFDGEPLEGALQALVDSGEAKPGLKKTAVFHDDGKRVILTGAGKRAD